MDDVCAPILSPEQELTPVEMEHALKPKEVFDSIADRLQKKPKSKWRNYPPIGATFCFLPYKDVDLVSELSKLLGELDAIESSAAVISICYD